jgi:hypothetical protein
MPAATARRRGDYTAAAPTSDMWVMLLVISLLAQLAGAGFLLYDYVQYPDPDKIPKLQDTPPSSSLQQTPAGNP